MITMIKSIRELDNLEPELKNRVLKRFEALPNFSEMIRYSYKEIEKLARHQNEFFMRWAENGIFAFRQGFTAAELSVIDSIGKSNRSEFIERLEKRVKVGTDRCSRFVRDLVFVCQKQAELQQQVDDLETARTKIGSGIKI